LGTFIKLPTFNSATAQATETLYVILIQKKYEEI